LADAIESTSKAGVHGQIVVNPDGSDLNSIFPVGASTSANQTNGDQVTKIKETIPTDPLNNNASLVISNADAVVSSTKTITKTIGAASYLKTLSMNSGGDIIQVSNWSLI